VLLSNYCDHLPLYRQSRIFARDAVDLDRSTLIEAARLNGVDSQAWLAQVLERIPEYKINRVDELLPWNTAPAEDRKADD